MSKRGRYPEKAIQEATSAWLASNWRFSEAFDDVEALGARFDSVGTLDGQLTLIEYKVSVSADIIKHAPDRSMSLESKIAGGLRAVYGRSSDNLSVAANKVWDRTRPPLVVIAAGSFSDAALSLLEGTLPDHSTAWQFDFAVWRWTGTQVDRLLEKRLGTLPEPRSYEALDVPILRGVTPRAKVRSLEDILEFSEVTGQRQLLEAFIDAARASGCSLETGRTTIGAGRKVEGKRRLVAAAYLQDGDAVRLNVGIDAAFVAGNAFFDRFSMAPAAGYLNINVYVSSDAELIAIFEALKG